MLAALAVWAVALAAALIRGRTPERAVALAFVVEILLTFCSLGSSLNGHRLPSFAGDVIASTVLTLVAVRTRCAWTRWAAPLQLISTATIASKVLDPTVGGHAYLLIGQLLGFGVLGFLLWGVFVEAPATGERWKK